MFRRFNIYLYKRGFSVLLMSGACIYLSNSTIPAAVGFWGTRQAISASNSSQIEPDSPGCEDVDCGTGISCVSWVQSAPILNFRADAALSKLQGSLNPLFLNHVSNIVASQRSTFCSTSPNREFICDFRELSRHSIFSFLVVNLSSVRFIKLQ